MSLQITPTIAPEAQADIAELHDKITAHAQGKIPDEKFRAFRLTRGVYGQRQPDVQMVRIKIPYGKLTPSQLRTIADVSDQFANGNLHLTTRQDIQLHYVRLADTPAVWNALEENQITLREACGNTVRNVTASSLAGIDPHEPFDVAPYAHALAHYFLRNPICQDMGRKFKIAFSSSSQDTGLTFFHDLGFIPLLKNENGQEQRGFRVVMGGGLGAVPQMAHTVSDFMPEEHIIPFTEGVLRVFDRYGERTRRNKARIKFLIKQLGIDEVLRLVAEEQIALKHQEVWVDRQAVPAIPPLAPEAVPTVEPIDAAAFANWRRTNAIPQKQDGYFAVALKITTGDIHSDKARALAALAERYAAQDIRVTVNQGLVLKFIPEAALPFWFNELHALGLAAPGYDTTADITACPGTDTCNLGISSSMGLSRELERQIVEEYPELVFESEIKIKISGCMNSCGQHEAATIGFHGSSLKAGAAVVPAMQVLLGGGVDASGQGYIADKIVKVPTKRVPQVLRELLADFDAKSQNDETYLSYYLRQGKRYFYDLLKHNGDLSTLAPEDYQDWEREVPFHPEIGVGECAGAMFDLVAIIFDEAHDKLQRGARLLATHDYADAIYYAYGAFVHAAKGYLLDRGVECNTQIGILNDFQTQVVDTGLLGRQWDFKAQVLQLNQHEPEAEFASRYLSESREFLQFITEIRKQGVLEFAGTN